MPIVTFQARLRQGVRLLCVDKNISANLTATFSVGNYDIDFPGDPPDQVGGVNVIYPNIYAWRLKRYVADLQVVPGFNLVDQRYKTYGGGNNVITAGPTIDNTNNWKVRSSLTCSFPTYIEIDIEKLNLPEGTDCIIYFEEGWVLEDRGRQLGSGAYEYPNAIQGNPSPQVDSFVQFRTPKYLSKTLCPSVFTMPAVPTRIKQLAANFPQALGTVTFRIRYSPGRFASLFMTNFAITPTARKTVRPSANLLSYVDNGFEAWNPFTGGLINYRLRRTDSNSIITSSLNIPDGWYYKGMAQTNLPSIATLSSNIYVIEGIVANLPAIASFNADVTRIEMTYNYNMVTTMNTINVRPRRFNIVTSSTASTSIVGVKVNLGSAAMTATSSLSVVGNKPMVINATTSANIGLFGTVDGVINWGDGTETVANSEGTYTKTYAAVGDYDITIRGNITGYGAGPNNTIGHTCLSVKSFGDLPLTNLDYAFKFAGFETYVPQKLSSTITSLKGIFYFGNQYRSRTYTSSFYPSKWITDWDTSNVTDMSFMFVYCINLTNDAGVGNFVSNWNVANVTNMESMFQNSSTSNFYSLNWNTNKVTNMKNMFRGVANGPQTSVTSFDVSNVTNMESMFEGSRLNASPMTNNFNSWNTSKVTNMSRMFRGLITDSGNIPLTVTNWDVSKVTNMSDMFFGPSKVISDITNWNTESVTNMDGMFGNLTSFNQDLTGWCVSLIPTAPTNFGGSPTWTNKPIWGTCPP